jgi:iron complex transport system permease protein
MSPRLLLNDPLAIRLVLVLRLPRIAAAILLGAGLSVSGVVLQTIFGNPLVEPGLIGVSQASAFGAVLCLLLFAPPLWVVQLVAWAGGGLGLLVSYRIARRFRFGGWILRLVLAGIAVSALFSAGVGLVKFAADPMSELPAITFWLLGSLSSVTWPRLLQVVPVVVAGITVMWLVRWRINLLSLEDRVSFSLGVSPVRERIVLLAAATAVTAALVALAGIVGWVGLLVPHAARRITGTDTARVLPVAGLLGALFVLGADTVARTLLAGEIPLGVLTSLLGAAGFIWLLSRNKVTVVR